MKHMELGTSGISVSPVGLGTLQFGSKSWGWGRDFGRDEALKIVERALDLGANLFDTAEMYGGGLSEEILGEAIRGRRDEAFVATKVSPHHLLHGSVLKAARRSLRRLDIDAIDLYQIHWPNPIIPIRRTMRAMERLVKEGKVRHIGVSNFGLSRLKSAQEALAREEIVSNQVKYNMLQRGVEKDLLPYCEKEKITILAYSPLAQGALTGKYTPENPPRGSVRAANPLFSSVNLRRTRKLLDVLQAIGDHRKKTIAQVALNWLMRTPTVAAIPGAKSVGQLEENVASSNWEPRENELARIQEALEQLRLSRLRSTLETPFRVVAGIFR